MLKYLVTQSYSFRKSHVCLHSSPRQGHDFFAKITVPWRLTFVFYTLCKYFKLQLFLLLLITLAIISFFVGTFTEVNAEEGVVGAVGWTDGTFTENLNSEYRSFEDKMYDAISTFGVFFPAGNQLSLLIFVFITYLHDIV